jgi:DNA repair exonuclease SbcCD ATPase subunit
MDLNSARKEFVTLIERGKEIITYDELSGGEKQLTNIAMAFAMHESLTMSTGVNIAFLDEVFESLSMDNIELVISLIREVFHDKTLFLITHHDSLPLSKCKTLSVTKTDGRTTYSKL